ncbi:hypothetical protein BDV98DRAFT_606414 [Pterulicium gracile]|uniref:DUF6534 domain-containing protein n=1 Tax=Pterulicium gracile TaxID=1884261 RepID=A0A5C3QFK5_9AGAR|nr:hypothetical protein BDV98DRAFT_606414 [Pterula gracilis]
MRPTPLSVSDILTPIEMGTLVSSVLYGVMCTQAYSYYILRRDKNDGLALKVLLAVVLTLETVHLVFTFIHLHKLTIQRFNDPRSLTDVSWPFAFTFSIVSVNDSLVQAFYTYRIRTLSRRWWPLIPVVILLPTRIVTGLYVTARMLQSESIRAFGASGDQHLCIVNLVIKLGLDVYITGSLCWLLWRWKGKGVTRQTRELVDKLVVWTAEVGLLNSICAFVILVLILTMKNMIWMSIVVIYPRIIANSLFAMLNGRPVDGRAALHIHTVDSTFSTGRSQSNRRGGPVSAIGFASHALTTMNYDHREEDVESGSNPEFKHALAEKSTGESLHRPVFIRGASV